MLKDNSDSHKDCGLDGAEDSVEIDVEGQAISLTIASLLCSTLS